MRSKLSKIFKTKLEQRQFEFRDEYWKDLEKKLDAHGGKGWGNYKNIFFSSLGLAVLVCAAFWFFYPEGKMKNEEVAVTKTNQSNLNGKEAKSLEEKSINKNDNHSSNHVLKSGNELTNSEIPGNEKNSPLPISVAGNKEEKTEIELKTDLHKTNESHNVKGELRSASANPDFKSNQKTHPGENSLTEIVPGTPSLNNYQAEINNGIELDKNQKNTTDISDISKGNNLAASEKNIFSYENANPGVLAGTENKTSLMLIQRIPLAGLPANVEQNLQNRELKSKIKNRKNSYFAGAYAGLMYTDKILKSNYDTLDGFIERREKEETHMITKNAGIDFGIGQDCWNLSIGINYHRQGEIIDYKPEFYQWMKKSTSEWNVNDNSYWNADTSNAFTMVVAEGDWQPNETVVWNNQQGSWDTIVTQLYVTDTFYQQVVYGIDSVYISKFDSIENNKIDSSLQYINDLSLKPEKITTKISYFEFPVLIGYELPIGRATLMVRTGFSIGLLSKINARYLKNNISGIEEIGITRMNKTMLNYLLRTGVLFYLTENVVLNFEPMFRINVNSVLKDSGYSQQYWNTGVNVGMMYRF